MWWKKPWRSNDSTTWEIKDQSRWTADLKLDMPFSKCTYNKKVIKCKEKIDQFIET